MTCKLSMSIISANRVIAVREQRQIYLYCSDLTNFAARISPKGKVSWLVEARIGGRNGKLRRVVIGHLDKMGIEDARRQAKIDIGNLAKGEDISLKKKERIAQQVQFLTASTLKELFSIYHQQFEASRYRTEAKQLFDKRVLPKLGARTSVAQIAKADIKQLLSDLDAGKRNVFALLRPFFKWCVENDHLAASPMASIKPPAPAMERERVLSQEEIKSFWAATSELSYFGPWMRLLLLTAQRREEVSMMEWSEIDKDHSTWTIPATKTKNGKSHVVHLSALVLETLATIPERGTYVFTARADTFLQGYSKAKAELDKLLPADMPAWTFHDLRRTAATGMQQLGHAPHVIEKLLNHSDPSKLRGIYQRFEYIEERRTALNHWSAQITKLVAEPQQTGPSAHTAQGFQAGAVWTT